MAWRKYGPFYSVSTSVASAERLLNTTLAVYEHAASGKRRIRQSANTDTYLPDSVHALVDAVADVDNHDIHMPIRHSVATPIASCAVVVVVTSFVPSSAVRWQLSYWRRYQRLLSLP